MRAAEALEGLGEEVKGKEWRRGGREGVS